MAKPPATVTPPPTKADVAAKEPAAERETCGIVMPISEIDGCPSTHWADVQSIIGDSIVSAGFTPNLVSNSEDATIIHRNIIQNLYDNPIIVCDVSGKNPNVMFELGMRLAFDRPVVIIKDDKTNYVFDTGGIEHVPYPRDLRFARIVDFQEKLKEKIIATRKAYGSSSYVSFLKHYGEFTVSKLETHEISKDEFILRELRQLSRSVARLDANRRVSGWSPPQFPTWLNTEHLVSIEGSVDVDLDLLIKRLTSIDGVVKVRYDSVPGPPFRFILTCRGAFPSSRIQEMLLEMLPHAIITTGEIGGSGPDRSVG